MYTKLEIKQIADFSQQDFCFKSVAGQLLEFYQWIRKEWTIDAQKSLKQKYLLDLRFKKHKLKFAWFAAKDLSKNDNYVLSQEVKVNRILCKAIALLPPVPPTNGLELTEAYQIMGEPIYLDELYRNYRKLVSKWHPDINSSDEALERFQLINQLYETLKNDWFTKYSPLIPTEKIGKENLAKAKSRRFPYSPMSFWQKI